MSEVRAGVSPDSSSMAIDPGVIAEHSLTVAIPAFNEEKNIEATIRAVLGAGAKVPDLRLEILVVDDGCKDRTAEIVQTLSKGFGNVRLIQNPQNIGLGASIRRAIDEAKTEKFVFVPGDNDIPVSTLELVFRYAYAADMVMIYLLNDESRGRSRYLISTLFRLIYTTFFNLYVVYINGPAIYPVQKLRDLHLHSTRFSIIAEINVKLLRQGVSFIELPSNRQVGMEGSTSATWRSLVETVRVFLQISADVYFREPLRYGQKPVRVLYDPLRPPPGSSSVKSA